MFDLKKFLDVDKFKSVLGKKGDTSAQPEDHTQNIQTDEDKIDAQISEIENEDKGGGTSENVPFFKDKKKLIRVGIGLALLYLIVDQFVLTNKEPDPFANLPAPTLKKNKNKRVKTATSTEAVVVTATGTATSTATATATVTVEAVSTLTASTSVIRPTLAPEVTPNSSITEVPIAPTPLLEATIVPEITPTPQATVSEIAKTEPTPTIVSTSEILPGMGETSHQTEKKDDLSTKLTEIVAPDVTPTPRKMEVKEYVAPPEFDNLGRGLVYNCKGRHWACVDKDSFIRCRQNEIWQRSVGKYPECSARNVYSSIDDCKIVQTHNINTAVVVDFCK